MKFAELYAGREFTAGPMALSEQQILDFARQWDPQWFHTDLQAIAERSPFGGLIASGWQTCCVAMRLAADTVLSGSSSFASPGIESIRWPAPVRPGDALRLQASVIEARVSKTKPNLGVLRWHWRLFNQHDVQVLDLLATSLFNLALETEP